MTDTRKRRKLSVKIDQLLAGHCRTPSTRVRERHALQCASSLVRDPGARVINQDAAHGLCGDGQEMGAVLIGNRLAADQAEIELVDDGVGFKGVVGTFPPKQTGCQLPQLGMDDGEQLVTRVGITISPLGQPLGDLRHFRNPSHSRVPQHDTDRRGRPL